MEMEGHGCGSVGKWAEWEKMDGGGHESGHGNLPAEIILMLPI